MGRDGCCIFFRVKFSLSLSDFLGAMMMMTSPDSLVHGKREVTSERRQFPQQVAGVLIIIIIIIFILIVIIIIIIIM